MEYITIKDNLITGHFCTGDKVEETENIKIVPNTFNGLIGDNLDIFNGDWTIKKEVVKKEEEVFNKENILVNFFSKANHKEVILVSLNEIENLDFWTEELPLEDEEFQYFDEDSQSWKVNALEKRSSEITSEIGRLQTALISTDYKVIKAFESGVTLDELYPDSKAERQLIRDEINKLKEELNNL